MEDTHRKVIRSNWVYLLDNTIPEELSDYMLQESIFTQDMYDEIGVERTRKDKMTKFLFTIQRRGPEAFGKLLLGLRATQQGFIADQLVQTLNRLNPNANAAPQPMQI